MDRRYVGIGLHRRRSVIYAMDAAGDRVFCERIANEPMRLLEVVSTAGEGAEVVIEATLAGIGRWICCATRGSRCIWRTRRATTGATGG